MRSLQRRIHENRDLGSGRSNIALKKLTKWDKEVLDTEKKVMEVGLTKFWKVEYWTPKVGDKKFWKFYRNVMKVNLRSCQRGMHENREFRWGRYNIA